MNRLTIGALLAGSAVAVGFQNYVFFSQPISAPIPVENQEVEPEWVDPPAVDRLPAIDEDSLTRWIASLGPASRNPFLTREESESAEHPRPDSSLRVAGVLWGADRRVAWIDGAPHSEGDWVGDVQIVRIAPDGVALRRGDGIDLVPLSPAESFLDTASSPSASHEDTTDD